AQNNGRLPIEDAIDVISVKLTFKRFLEIAEMISQPVAVITDNDGKYDIKITQKYKDYTDVSCIKICADDRNELNTLEPQFVDANISDLTTLRDAIELNYDKYDTKEKIIEYMLKKENKTTWALKVFESSKSVKYPKYINDAVKWCNV
nr:hypothetical protein [Desulfobacterales bacterium]